MKRVWRFFASTGLAVTLAVCICAVTGWGSIIVMRNRDFFDGLESVIFFPWLFTSGLESLSLTHWMFLLVFLVFLYAVNTTVCTADRLYNIIRKKRPLKSLLPHVVHVGFMVALIGHLAGSLYGFRSYGNLVTEGRAVAVPHTESLEMRLDGLDAEFDARGRPKRIATTVTLIEDGREVRTRAIKINGPLIYRGIAFYHADQGSVTTGLRLGIDGEERDVAFGEGFTTGDGRAFRLGALYRDLAFDARGRPYSRSTEFRNPYQAIVSAAGQSALLNVGRPGASVVIDGKTVTLLGYGASPYAVLTVSKDPGIGFIIAGSAILVTGMLGLLFLMPGKGELMKRAA